MTKQMRGSFFNRLMDGNQYEELHVGMGATECCYSDRHAYTVQRIVSEKRVIVTRDEVKRLDSNYCSEDQDYEFTSVPLVEGKREKMCTNFIIRQFTCHVGDNSDHEPSEVCKYASEHGTCEGCPFFKFHKPSNGITLIRTKNGWKQMGTDTYFALGVREEYFDYTF